MCVRIKGRFDLKDIAASQIGPQHKGVIGARDTARHQTPFNAAEWLSATGKARHAAKAKRERDEERSRLATNQVTKCAVRTVALSQRDVRRDCLSAAITVFISSNRIWIASTRAFSTSKSSVGQTPGSNAAPFGLRMAARLRRRFLRKTLRRIQVLSGRRTLSVTLLNTV